MTFAHLCLEELWSGITNWYDILLSWICECAVAWKRFSFLFDSKSFETSGSTGNMTFGSKRQHSRLLLWRIWKTRCRKTSLKDEIQWKILSWFIYELNSSELHGSNTLNGNLQDDASTVQRVTSLLDINSMENVSLSAIHFGFKLLTTSEPSRRGACLDD